MLVNTWHVKIKSHEGRVSYYR